MLRFINVTKRSIDISGKRLMAVATLFVAAFLGFLAPELQAKPQEKLMNRPYADMKRWHLGFSIGMCMQDLKFTHNGYVTPEGEQWFVETPSWTPGINVQVLADLRLHKYLNLRLSPGMSFSFKNAEIREHFSGKTYRQDIKSVYVLVPLDLKISGDRLQNSRPYVTVGAMGSFDVGRKGHDYMQFKMPDCYLTFGLGCDFYLPYFKFIPEVKFCFGLTDILNHKRPDLDDNPEMFKVTQSLRKVTSNMIMFTFYFE